MSWTSLEEGDTSSSSDDDDLENSNRASRPSQTKPTRPTGKEIPKSCPCFRNYRNSKACIKEPNFENYVRLRGGKEQVGSILAMKDERIRSLQKLINSQREQLYHFLNTSIKKEILLDFKDTCEKTESFNHNENLCMALDKFKYDNEIPTEQTLVREDVLRTLLKLERLMKHQEKLVRYMEQNAIRDVPGAIEDLTNVNSYQYDSEWNGVRKLWRNTKQIHRQIQMLKVQLKKLALIEEERIDLVERVYSVPSDQRQYCAHIIAIEHERLKLRCDIDKLARDYNNLNEKYCLLVGAEQELSRLFSDTKSIAEKCEAYDKLLTDEQTIRSDKIQPGMDTRLATRDQAETEKFSDDFRNKSTQDAEITSRLTDLDAIVRERDGLKKQTETLMENCLRLQKEIKTLKLANRTEDLLVQLKKTCAEKEQLNKKFDQLSKDSSEMLKTCRETARKVTEERDQLRMKLSEYLPIEADLKILRFKASQSDAYRQEVERLKSELEAARAEVARAEAAVGTACPTNDPRNTNANVPDRDVSSQLQQLKVVEKQNDALSQEISRYKHALLKQEEEVKDLMDMVVKLNKQMKTPRKTSTTVNPTEGTPEGPEVNSILSSSEEKRLSMIQCRLRQARSNVASPREIPRDNHTDNTKSTLMKSVKSFLGLDDSQCKSTV